MVSLRHLRPETPFNNVVHSLRAHAEFFAESCKTNATGRIPTANLYNFRFCQLTERVCGSSQVRGAAFSTTAFFSHVQHVIGLAPYEKMLRPYTGWVVARVTDDLILRKIPVRKRVADTMGEFSAPRAVRSTAKYEDPVALPHLIGSPLPTSTLNLVDFSPETFRKRLHSLSLNYLRLNVKGGVA